MADIFTEQPTERLFHKDMLEKVEKMIEICTGKIYVFHHDNDKALRFSRIMNRGIRLGKSGVTNSTLRAKYTELVVNIDMTGKTDQDVRQDGDKKYHRYQFDVNTVNQYHRIENLK